jgi:hypothetical protein
MTGGGPRTDGVAALLRAVLPRHADADVVAYSGQSIPRRTLAAFGFGDDGAFPLSMASSRSTLVAYDLSDGERPWHLGDRDAREPGSWALSFTELDAH